MYPAINGFWERCSSPPPFDGHVLPPTPARSGDTSTSGTVEIRQCPGCQSRWRDASEALAGSGTLCGDGGVAPRGASRSSARTFAAVAPRSTAQTLTRIEEPLSQSEHPLDAML